MIVPTFAVIPTVAVGGPLAILAMLFPALFGKPQDVMRRWLALLSVASILSMLYLFWWGSQVKLWQILAGLTLAGAAWGWWRHRTLVRTGYGESLRPSEGEGIVFRILSVIVFGLVAYGLGAGVLLQPPFKEFLLMAVVVWAGTLGIVLLNWQSRRDPEAPPGVPLETMMLGGLTLVCGGMAWALQTPATPRWPAARRITRPASWSRSTGPSSPKTLAGWIRRHWSPRTASSSPPPTRPGFPPSAPSIASIAPAARSSGNSTTTAP